MQSTLIGLASVVAGVAGGVLLRYIGSRIGLSELRETQRILREAQEATAPAAPTQAQGFEASLERIARALELLAVTQGPSG